MHLYKFTIILSLLIFMASCEENSNKQNDVVQETTQEQENGGITEGNLDANTQTKEAELQLSETKERFITIAEHLSISGQQAFMRHCYFVDGTQGFLLDYLAYPKDDAFNWIGFDDKLFDEKDKTAIFFKQLKKYLISLDELTLEKVVKELAAWAAIEETIAMPGHFEEEAKFTSTLEVISLIDETKEFVLRYIDPEMGQYWGSLASGESTEAYYDFLAYLDQLSPTDKLCFFGKYYAAVCQIVESANDVD